jgi:hypothetical protein
MNMLSERVAATFLVREENGPEGGTTESAPGPPNFNFVYVEDRERECGKTGGSIQSCLLIHHLWFFCYSKRLGLPAPYMHRGVFFWGVGRCVVEWIGVVGKGREGGFFTCRMAR